MPTETVRQAVEAKEAAAYILRDDINRDQSNEQPDCEHSDDDDDKEESDDDDGDGSVSNLDKRKLEASKLLATIGLTKRGSALVQMQNEKMMRQMERSMRELRQQRKQLTLIQKGLGEMQKQVSTTTRSVHDSCETVQANYELMRKRLIRDEHMESSSDEDVQV